MRRFPPVSAEGPSTSEIASDDYGAGSSLTSRLYVDSVTVDAVQEMTPDQIEPTVEQRA